MSGIPTANVDIQWAVEPTDAPDDSQLITWARHASQIAGCAEGDITLRIVDDKGENPKTMHSPTV